MFGLGEVTDRVEDVVGRPSQGGMRSFSQSLKEGDFDHFGADASPDEWNRLSTFTVPAQENYRYGYGKANNPENQGYLFIDLRAADGTEIDAKVRLAQTNAQERQHLVVFEEDAEALRGSKFDKSQQLALPEQVDKPKVGRDSKLVLEVKTSAKQGPATVDEDESSVRIPVTNYESKQ